MTTCLPALVLALAFLVPPAPAAEGPPEKRAEENTYTVAPKPLRIEVGLDGVFEAARKTEVSLVPRAWGQFRVLRAVEPGTHVKKGDVLVRLDPEDLDKQIRSVEAGLALSDQSFKQARENLRLLELATKEKLEHARVVLRRAQQDFDYFLEHDWAFVRDLYEVNKEWPEVAYKTALIELEQLKKMYEADDLIEVTEDLVLMRETLQAKSAEIYHRQAEPALRWKRDVTIPRQLEDREKKLRDAKLSYEQARTNLSLALERRRLELKKTEFDRLRSAESLQDLKADREAMVVRAPAAGIVYYGRCVRGRWVGAGKVEGKLRKGGQLAAYEVFMTIVEPDEVFVRAAAPEQHLHDLAEGQAVTVVPTGYPDDKLEGEVEAVRIRPGAPEPYALRIALEEAGDHVLPGMTCRITLVPYEKKDALLVPASAVFTEEADEEARYVWLRGADGEAVRRPVEVGRQKENALEVLEGLEAGDVLFLKKPGE